MQKIYTFKQKFGALCRYEMRSDYFIRTIRDFFERWIEDGFKLFLESFVHLLVSVLIIFLSPIIIIIKWVFAPVFWLYYSFTYKGQLPPTEVGGL